MDTVVFFLRGGLIGLSVAAPVGPMAVLCISRTLANGVAMGLATGAAATTVQAAYALALLLGLHWIAPWLVGNQVALSLAGSAIMLLFAGRLLRRRAPHPGRVAPGGSLAGAYLSALALCLVNPMTLILLLGSLTLVAGPEPLQGTDAALLLFGLCAGSGAWWLVLNGAAALLRGRMNPAVLRGANQAMAALLVLFSLLALSRMLPG